jgi:hypothetical protein
MTYEIVWRSRYGTEVVDTADDLATALYLVGEYQLAYGEGVVSYRPERG